MKKSRVQVYDRTNITKITEQKTRNGLLLTADNGFEIRAKKIIYATGYESPEYVKKIVKLKSTYAIASEPVSNFEGWGFGQCLIWEHATSYVYARTSTDGRVILGGEDEDFVNPMRRDKMVSAKSSILLKKAKKMFPKMKEDLKIAYGWAGTFGETKDGLPYIGEVRGFPHSYFALCYGANGTNFALIGAETIRDLYLEKLKPSENVFGFRRN